MNWQSGNDYSHKDMIRMQQEAVERVKEMQERSRLAVEQSNNRPPYPNFAKAPAESSKNDGNRIHSSQQVIQIPQSKQSPSGGLLGGLFGAGNPLGSLIGGSGDGPISRALDALGIDNDKIIILVLLFILINNQADKKLILALCYIML